MEYDKDAAESITELGKDIIRQVNEIVVWADDYRQSYNQKYADDLEKSFQKYTANVVAEMKKVLELSQKNTEAIIASNKLVAITTLYNAPSSLRTLEECADSINKLEKYLQD